MAARRQDGFARRILTSDKVVRRRHYGDAFKTQVLTECNAPGASVAKVAMAYGINANVVHRWRQLAREGAQATVAKPSEFVPVDADRKLTSKAG